MATIKSYSDLKQSRKLAEILPLESADMFYIFESITGELRYHPFIITEQENRNFIISEHNSGKVVVSWSLAALLNYLKSKNKFPEIKELSDGRFKLTTFIWDGKNSIQVSIADNLVDACYEMILKLNKQNMI